MEKKKKKLKIFDFQKEGKGISKNRAKADPGLKNFFISYKNSFSKLVSVNIFFVLGNFPLIFLIAALSGVSKLDIFLPLSDVFQNINGLITADGGYTPYKLSLFALEGLQNQTTTPTVGTYFLYGIGALAIFTFGPVNTSTSYIIRNLVSGEPVFVWSDFWYSFKRNIKQSLPVGILDIALNALLIFNIYTMFMSTDKFFASMLFWCYIIIFYIYFTMRYYIYVQLVTFKLSVFKILKNSLIFALIGFKRNILATIGNILCVFLVLMFLFGLGGILVPLAVAAPLAILFSTMAFMKVYASYYKIKEIMIEPYLNDHPEERKTYDDIDIIMRDDVTEKERLEEIKRKNNITH